jgi:hypothetical protein
VVLDAGGVSGALLVNAGTTTLATMPVVAAAAATVPTTTAVVTAAAFRAISRPTWRAVGFPDACVRAAACLAR